MSEEAKMGTEEKKENKGTRLPALSKAGEKPMGTLGIILTLVYLILFSIILLFGLVQLWPPQAPPQASPQTPPQTQAGESVSTNSAVHFYFLTFNNSEEIRMILIVVLAGALGALVHALRSFYWYVGHRMMVRSWLAMFILLPFVGTTLGLLFYFVIRGGFFSAQATSEVTSPFGFAALAGLVGLFSEQAVLKLKQVAETMLAKAPKGEEAAPQEEE